MGEPGAGPRESRFDEVFGIVDEHEATTSRGKTSRDDSGDDAIAAGAIGLVIVLLGPIFALFLERVGSGRGLVLLAGGLVAGAVGFSGGSLGRSTRSLGSGLVLLAGGLVAMAVGLSGGSLGRSTRSLGSGLSIGAAVLGAFEAILGVMSVMSVSP